jgi:hypothetical protein
MTDELMKLLKETFEYSMTNVHTSFPGTVESYDPKTRRADIQPSLKRRLPDGSFLALPVIPDVPVIYQGSKKFTIHFPLEKGDEVEVKVCERSTDAWRDKGGKDIEDEDPRRFSVNDCYCTPGLQPVDFIPVEDPGLNIVHRTAPDGDFVSSVTMDDDKVEVKYKEKTDVLMEDDHVRVKTGKCTSDMAGEVIELDNGKAHVKANGEKVSVKNGSKSLFTVLNSLLADLAAMKTLGSPANHQVSPDDIAKFQQLKADLGMLMEA